MKLIDKKTIKKKIKNKTKTETMFSCLFQNKYDKYFNWEKEKE